MAYAVGVGLALAVCLWATWIGLDRDRAFYPTVMMVIALFLGLSVLGFKGNRWVLVGALFAHGVFDRAGLVADVLPDFRHHRRRLPGVASQALAARRRRDDAQDDEPPYPYCCGHRAGTGAAAGDT